eukprot:tig00021319_g20227.t1
MMDEKAANKLKVAELRDELKKHGLPTDGIKAILVKRLVEFFALQEASASESVSEAAPAAPEKPAPAAEPAAAPAEKPPAQAAAKPSASSNTAAQQPADIGGADAPEVTVSAPKKQKLSADGEAPPAAPPASAMEIEKTEANAASVPQPLAPAAAPQAPPAAAGASPARKSAKRKSVEQTPEPQAKEAPAKAASESKPEKAKAPEGEAKGAEPASMTPSETPGQAAAPDAKPAPAADTKPAPSQPASTTSSGTPGQADAANAKPASSESSAATFQRRKAKIVSQGRGGTSQGEATGAAPAEGRSPPPRPKQAIEPIVFKEAARPAPISTSPPAIPTGEEPSSAPTPSSARARRSPPAAPAAPSAGGTPRDERLVPASRKPPTEIVLISHLKRPFTEPSLRELLSGFGKVQNVWLDSIKSKCFATFESAEEGAACREGLYNLLWPPRTGQKLHVEFFTEAEMQRAIEGSQASASSAPTRRGPQGGVAAAAAAAAASVRPQEGARRERDGGPAAAKATHDQGARHREREEAAGPRSLDELFRKTRTRPHIYWLPLDPAVVAAKRAAQAAVTGGSPELDEKAAE